MNQVRQNNKGETLAETLVAILIGVLALLMLPMAIVSSAKINHKIAKDDLARTVERRERSPEKQISGTGIGVKIDEWSVPDSDIKIYRDSAGYVYYDYAPSALPDSPVVPGESTEGGLTGTS